MNTRVFLLLHILCISGCAADSYFDRMSSGYHLTALMKEAESNSTPNRISPSNLYPAFRRVELVSDTGLTVAVFERDNSTMSMADFTPLAVPPSNQVLLKRGQLVSGRMKVIYAKVYLYAIAFPLRVTNFNESLQVDLEETFFVIYNPVSIDQIPFERGDTAAFDRKTGRIGFFDTTRPSQTPIVSLAVAKYAFTTELGLDGEDVHGAFKKLAVTGIELSDRKALRISMTFESAELFRWTDVLSGAGTFDAASQDVFNWRLNFSATGVDIAEL